MPAMIELRNLTRRFGAVTAVEDLTLEIPQGEIFGLVGPDGAGKTTTLRLLCGLLDPQVGVVRVAGLDVRTHPDEVKDQLGYMAQRFGLYQDLTVEENMDFYAELFGLDGPPREELKSRLLRMTRMEPFRARHAGKLSGGMKQKLALMCTLLHHPRILILDEPTNGVDPVSRRDFWTILYQLVKDGLTVLVSTAYLDEAERCNRVGLMHKGRLIRCDRPAALKDAYRQDAWTVRTAKQREARALLAAQPGVLSVEPSGAELHLFLRANGRENLQRLLEASGCGPAFFEPLDPSLEDVFIAEIRRQELGAAA